MKKSAYGRTKHFAVRESPAVDLVCLWHLNGRRGLLCVKTKYDRYPPVPPQRGSEGCTLCCLGRNSKVVNSIISCLLGGSCREGVIQSRGCVDDAEVTTLLVPGANWRIRQHSGSASPARVHMWPNHCRTAIDRRVDRPPLGEALHYGGLETLPWSLDTSNHLNHRYISVIFVSSKPPKSVCLKCCAYFTATYSVKHRPLVRGFPLRIQSAQQGLR